jgi:cell division ATPase FtsA
LKHLKQLVEYTTGGLSARIGFPTAYLSRDNKEEMKHPMFSTGLGLVLEGYKAYDDMKEDQRKDFYPELFETAKPEPALIVEVATEETTEPEPIASEVMPEPQPEYAAPVKPEKKGFLSSMTKTFQNWFEDKDVNGDFE